MLVHEEQAVVWTVRLDTTFNEQEMGQLCKYLTLMDASLLLELKNYYIQEQAACPLPGIKFGLMHNYHRLLRFCIY